MSESLRRCAGCFCELPQQDLIRVVKTAKNEVKVDVPGSKRTLGRGAYVCANENCLSKALKKMGKKSCPLQFWLGVAIPEIIVKELQDLALKKAS